MVASAKNRIDAMFRALSDWTRVRIVHLLSTSECCVCDIVAILKIPQPTASRHLASLRKVGLVASRKDGYWNYYRLAPAKGKLHTRLLECLSCLRDLPELAADRLALKKLKSSCS